MRHCEGLNLSFWDGWPIRSHSPCAGSFVVRGIHVHPFFVGHGVTRHPSKIPAAQEPRSLIARSRALRKEIETEAPQNPRLLWVEGPIFWNVPPQYGEGQPKAIETYEKGLDSIQSQKTTATDWLDPTCLTGPLFEARKTLKKFPGVTTVKKSANAQARSAKSAMSAPPALSSPRSPPPLDR
jgi:hypothetical protein